MNALENLIKTAAPALILALDAAALFLTLSQVFDMPGKKKLLRRYGKGAQPRNSWAAILGVAILILNLLILSGLS